MVLQVGGVGGVRREGVEGVKSNLVSYCTGCCILT